MRMPSSLAHPRPRRADRSMWIECVPAASHSPCAGLEPRETDGSTVASRRAPKLHVVDSGVAARLLRVSPARLSAINPTALTQFGHLLETFVVREITKQLSWLDEEVSSGHWRTHDGLEVDFVVEFDDGSVLAFEVKANERVTGSDLSGLRSLREAVGSRFLAGVALSTGSRSYTYEDRLHVMPIDRLWSSDSQLGHNDAP